VWRRLIVSVKDDFAPPLPFEWFLEVKALTRLNQSGIWLAIANLTLTHNSSKYLE